MPTPKWLEKFRDADEEDGAPRQRWKSQTTFVLAAVGSAIGLGNFWRFPYLCFKWGGATFLIPYLGCLFFLGIPMLMLELSLGQKIQRGDIGVFRGMHPKLYGIGLASVFASFSITFYYNVIISWALVYFFNAFQSNLPWGLQNAVVENGRRLTHLTCEGMYATEEFFYKDILHVYDADCIKYDTQNFIGGNEFQHSEWQWQVWLCALLTWFVVYFCVFKGVKSSSYVVWVTVPLPVAFIFIMVMKGLTLDNASEGIRMYLMGEQDGEMPDIGAKLQQASMWAEACAQIFFSVGVCMGVMTSYASYNPIDKPIIGDSFRIAFYNSLLSFFAGFAVFSVVGYLKGIESPVSGKTSSIGLAFIAYPAAIEQMPARHFWIILLSLTLFALGVDSAFSMVEATSTVISDTPAGSKIPKKCIALLLCVSGMAMSTFFCFNWGFTYFDTVDHYLAVYLMLLLGIFQCFGAGWIWRFDEAVAAAGKKSVMVNFFGFWVTLVILGILAYFAFPTFSWVSMPVFWVLQIGVWAASWLLSKDPETNSRCRWVDWYDLVFLSGVRHLARSMTKLSKDKQDEFPWWEDAFEFWWGFSIKYFIPWAIWWLLMLTLQSDVTGDASSGNGYGDYHIFWQIMGFVYPVGGLLCFAIPAFFNIKPEEFSAEVVEALTFQEKKGRRKGASPNKVAAEEPKKTEEEPAKEESAPLAAENEADKTPVEGLPAQ